MKKNNRKVIITIALIIIISVLSYLLFSMSAHPKNLQFNIDTTKISKIVISSSTSSKEYTATLEEEINCIISNLNIIKFVRGKSSKNIDELGPKITIYKKSGGKLLSLNMNKDNINYNGFYYNTVFGDLDYNYIITSLK